jgi:hypothetical protein
MILWARRPVIVPLADALGSKVRRPKSLHLAGFLRIPTACFPDARPPPVIDAGEDRGGVS